jgi:two-component system, NtrC family, sensor histidine kinase HydH
MEDKIAARAEGLYQEQRLLGFKRIDRLFVYLLLGQWIFGVIIAVFYSPYAWEGKVRTTHAHVYAAVFLGGALSCFPIYLATKHAGTALTRNVIAVAQMLWSALLIHLTGGRIETHFHVFGSLAFLAFYRDWAVLVPATVVVAADHFIRQMLWPESVFGIVNPESWRFLEHAFWVVFEDIVLVLSCVQGMQETRVLATKQAELESISDREKEKSSALDRALTDLKHSHETLVRTEKLAALGQLAASVGHELRNPLAAVRNAATYIGKKLADGGDHKLEPRIQQFIGVIEREVAVCVKIIGDLLDFARERPTVRAPCPLRPLVDEAIGVVGGGKVEVVNEVPEDLPIPELDREQFRQIIINLVQNAIEAIPSDRNGRVVLRASGGGATATRFVVEDNGAGIPPDVASKVFEPLFTTKTKGTGLGLAIVSSVVKRHDGEIHIESEHNQGTRIVIDLPPPQVPHSTLVQQPRSQEVR